MIQLQVIGNLGKDAETKTINGRNYLSFSVCHTDRYLDNQGQKQSKSTWVDCLKSDENGKLAQYLTKGTKVFVSGKPQAGAYSLQDGTPKASLSLMVNSLELLSRQEESPKSQQPAAQQYQHPVTGKTYTPQPPLQNNQDIDPLPF